MSYLKFKYCDLSEIQKSGFIWNSKIRFIWISKIWFIWNSKISIEKTLLRLYSTEDDKIHNNKNYYYKNLCQNLTQQEYYYKNLIKDIQKNTKNKMEIRQKLLNSSIYFCIFYKIMFILCFFIQIICHLNLSFF